MSNSRRKTPICGITTADSEKQDKRIANRKLRHAVKITLRKGLEALPVMKEVANIWGMDKDGKQRFDPIKHPDLMRK